MKTTLSPQVRARLWFVAGGLALAAACSSTGTPDTGDTTTTGAGVGGTSAHAGTTAHAGASGSAGSGVGAGTNAGGASLGAGGGLFHFDAGPDAALDGAGLQDALPDVATDACLSTGMLPPGPIMHTCAPPTDNECNGLSDVNPALPNGMYGNMFDDDCDGKVDEGCQCDPSHAPGTTRDCYLTPSSQVDPTTMLPVGWCTMNSKGTEACDPGTGEMGKPIWDGYCKGASAPFPTDVCAPGDYDCDGTDANPAGMDCSCGMPVVQCPSAPIVISPYPNPMDTTMKKPNPYDPDPNTPFIIDGDSWIQNAMGATAINWKWTITGGDCDNILPFPTFAIYNGPDTTANGIGRFGTLATNIGSNGAQHGLVFGPVDDGQMGASAHQIWPAFSLSGDYVVQGSFNLNGMDYSCSVQVQVRAPGLRAEMCWDIGATAVAGMNTSDLDLHVSRLQGGTGSPHGWFGTAGKAPQSDDCFYQCDSGCRTGNFGFCGVGGQAAPAPGWGYAASDDSSCHGWGSRREKKQTCDNPRLDLDDYICDPNIGDPTNANFCGPENINIDNPNSGDQFAVGVHYYTGNTKQHPHVNIYCNGQRQLALGYDPTTTPAITKPEFSEGYNPQTDANGAALYYYTGDFWEVARVTWSGDAMNPCTIEPIPSANPKADKDGAANSCVDTNAQNLASENKPQTQDWYFDKNKDYPTAPGSPPSALCWH